MQRIDARLQELRFLSKLDLEEKIVVQGVYDGSQERQMIISLINQGYINDIDTHFRYSEAVPGGLERAVSESRLEDIYQLRRTSNPSKVELHISHKGRVRFYELEQQLKSGRDRDETGLLWDKRHLLTDLSIEILHASHEHPLSLVYMDMNGLKGINDEYGHAIGDKAIQAFFRVILNSFERLGEAYRNGGDEVVVLFRGIDEIKITLLLQQFKEQLDKETLESKEGEQIMLTASCGATTITSASIEAETALAEADAMQYHAKEASKKAKKRRTVITINTKTSQQKEI